MSQFEGIVNYLGINEEPYLTCGYCRGTQKPSESGKFQAGMWAQKLSADSYQHLIDRGWRRSGKYCYKILLEKSCCPAYTIRCEALDFQISRSQKKTLKRFHEYLANGTVPRGTEKCKISQNNIQFDQVPFYLNDKKYSIQQIDQTVNKRPDEKPDQVNSNKASMISTFKAVSTSNDATTFKTVVKDKSRKAKNIRIKNSLKKLMSNKGVSEEVAWKMMKEKRLKKLEKTNPTKVYEDYFNQPMPLNPAHQLEIKFVSTSSDKHHSSFIVAQKVYQKYQVSIHKDKPEDCTPKSFKRFLIDNPFEPESFTEVFDFFPNSYGSYHMQYWLDGKLIAVGVIDILTECVSSVYFFYDPDYYFLNLGTYSALREIWLTRQLNKLNKNLKYYYMGFYIDTCDKMSYKSKFKPSFLLCPRAFNWHPIEKVIAKIKQFKSPNLEENEDILDQDGTNIRDKDILILYNHTLLNLSVYKRYRMKIDDNEINEYAKLVGKHCTKKLLLFRE